MAPRSMTLDVLVRLKDSLSSPLRGLMNSLQGVANMAKKIGVVGTAVAAISFMAPIEQAAAFQQKLVDIAGTANLSGSAAYAFVDQLKGKYEGLALQIGQSSDTIASGAGQMIASGMDMKVIDQSIGGIGKAATAAHAEFSDMAGVATSLMQTLKLPADQLDGALAGLIVSGKEGAFEMKDMARYLPTLTGQMAKFGVTGREAVNFLGAALQVAKKGTSDPAEAANNLKNFLSKILSPATVKNFKEAGVDIQAVMKDAATKGINPIEAVVQKIAKLSGASGTEIAGMMKKAKASGLEGADALANVREQLEKIHGAGKLGELFSDQQVMDFLIPMLGNIDEYKRIKEEVAKATGAVTDRDFETQMMALNQQLTIFKEIGTQATREVGLAFGQWLPMINVNLEAALKWLREFDQETGGMVRQALMLAGGGVLVAAALGTLGVVLPIVAAGFGALASLISPVGILLALIAYGATQIYKNWGTLGPRVTQTWQFLKRGFFDLADGVRDGGQRIIDTGREFADRFGPRIRNGLASAWADIKGGLANIRGLFDGFMKGLDLKVDLSGLTIEDAKIATFRALESALKGIASGWEELKSIGSGFAPYMKSMGEDLGGTVKSAGEFANNIVRLVDALAKLGSAPQNSDVQVIDVDKMVGDLAGSAIQRALRLIKDVAAAAADVAGNIATLAEMVNKGIEWEKLLPEGVVNAWNNFAGVLEKIKGLMATIGAAGNVAISPDGKSAAPGSPLANGGTAGNPDNGSDREAARNDMLAPLPRAANGTVKVDVKVTGPGQVTGVTSSSPSVVPTATGGDTGRAVGRP